MEVSVWDTYVKREGNKIMHFDILVPSQIKDENIIFRYGKEYLKRKPFPTGVLSSKECIFCHVEQATNEMINEITKNGFYIIEMENCN
jgi:hypothetical protein